MECMTEATVDFDEGSCKLLGWEMVSEGDAVIMRAS